VKAIENLSDCVPQTSFRMEVAQDHQTAVDGAHIPGIMQT
jgi:hypothetical protein